MFLHGWLFVRAPPPAFYCAGKNCLAQAVVLARLFGLMHLDLLAYVVANVCFLPIPSRRGLLTFRGNLDVYLRRLKYPLPKMQ